MFQPAIFVGAVATGDTVMKSGVARDAVAEAENIIGFEMEASGLWEQLPTLIIKSVCDYADSHKNKKWQTYAAGTAAAAAKAVAMFHTPADRPRLREMKAAQPESILPFPPDPQFLARPEVSDWIGEKARTPGARAALIGLGGIGKSQLAIRYAHGVRNRSHVFWVNATTQATLEESIRAISERLNLEKPADSRDDIFRRVGNWLGNEQNGAWTVVLDNFDDISILRDDDPRLQKLLPQSSTGFLLVTSRSTKAAERLTGSGNHVIYLVPELGEEAALELFQTKLEKGCEKEVAQEVVRLLEFMPLAISQAAAYINSRADQISVRDYADMFQAGDEKRKALLEWEYDELRRYQGGSNSVLGTWAITLEQMQREKPSAVDLLSLMSFFSPQSIPEWALKPLYMDSIERHLPELTLRDVMPSSVTSALSRVVQGRRFLNKTCMDNDLHKDTWSLWATQEMGIEKEEGSHDAKEIRKAEAGKPKKKARWSAMTKLAGRAMRSHNHKDGDASISTAVLRDETAESLGEDLDLLRKYLMVTPTAEGGFLKMHPLVRYSTQHWLSQSKALAVWKKRFLEIMVACLESTAPEQEWRLGDLDGHIEFLIDENPEDPPTARLWNIVCTHLVSRWQERGSKDPPDLVALEEKMVAVADKILGPGDRVTIANRTWLANYALEQGEFAKAETMFVDVINKAWDIQGSGGDQVAECRFQQAKALRAQGYLHSAWMTTGYLYWNLTKNEEPIYGLLYRITRPLTDGVIFVTTEDYTGYSIAAVAESAAALGYIEEAAERVQQLLQGRGFMDPEGPKFGDITACLADLTKTLSMHRPADKTLPLLFNILSHLERIPQMWRQYPFNVCAPFHRHLAASLDRQGDTAAADLVVNKGIRLLASAFSLPELQPPGLASSLIEAPDDDDGTRRQLLHQVIQGLDSEAGRFNVDFLRRMANIGRYLFVQNRAAECTALLDAICEHMAAEWGEKHVQTRAVVGFRDDMATWIAGGRPTAREPEAGREAWRLAEERCKDEGKICGPFPDQEMYVWAVSPSPYPPNEEKSGGSVVTTMEGTSRRDHSGGKAAEGVAG